MSTIKVEDIAHVRFSAPDLAAMKAFLLEFGLVETQGPGGSLYMRGAGGQPFLHATAEGAAGFQGLGFRARSLSDLEALAAVEGVTVEEMQAPGGGSVVRLMDPNGIAVEVVAGQAAAPVLPLPKRAPENDGRTKQRLRAAVQMEPGPAHVVRLGHAVLEVKDFRISEAWYKSRFGFITSDEIELAPGMAIGAFLRCDRGPMPSDHHTLFLLQSPHAPRLNHAAFEVADFDDLMRGHTHLKQAKREAAWGVGRHILGSQIFDYWKDPWGHELEHWTDGDLFAADDAPRKADIQALIGVQWGPRHPLAGGAS